MCDLEVESKERTLPILVESETECDIDDCD